MRFEPGPCACRTCSCPSRRRRTRRSCFIHLHLWLALACGRLGRQTPEGPHRQRVEVTRPSVRHSLRHSIARLNFEQTSTPQHTMFSRLIVQSLVGDCPVFFAAYTHRRIRWLCVFMALLGVHGVHLCLSRRADLPAACALRQIFKRLSRLRPRPLVVRELSCWVQRPPPQ